MVTTTHTVTQQATPAAPCTGSELSGTFAVVSGSQGAGQIAYLLTLKNTSQTRCYVFGLPQAQLLGANGSALATHIAAAQASSGGTRVMLSPGAAAVAQARVSVTVAGPGDAQSGACQPKASTLRVTPDGGGTVDAAITPPTSVCERGTLYFDALAAGA
jgi:hypothetical protein